jgi:hypothetical protein
MDMTGVSAKNMTQKMHCKTDYNGQNKFSCYTSSYSLWDDDQLHHHNGQEDEEGTEEVCGQHAVPLL